MKKLKNKKKLIPILVLFILVGITIAYFQTSNSFENIFNTSKYGAKVEEVFESPNDWKPGDETPKTITAKNTGNVCENVRVSYTEEWTSENDDSLPLEFATNKKTAILNLDNTSDWIYDNGYYYYQSDLLEGETTTSFLKSVTFNPEYTPTNLNCTTNGNTQECKSSGDSYEGAEYKLTITVETIQCDVAEDEWGYIRNNGNSNNYVYSINDNTVNIGDPVTDLGITYQDPEEAATNFSKIVFLRHSIINNRIASSSVAFVKDDTTYYLQGGGSTLNSTTGFYNEDSIYYATNKQVLDTAFGSSDCFEYINPTYYSCFDGDVHAEAEANGNVNAYGGDFVDEYYGYWRCNVRADGSSLCAPYYSW